MSEKDQKTRISLNKLIGWDKNPRVIDEDELQRLKNQLVSLGEYKPLIVTMDGENAIVLGGNMRLKALREIHKEQKNDLEKIAIWVSIVDAPDDKTRLEYALSDNDRAGRYDEDALGELIAPFDDLGELRDYRIDTGYSTSLDAIGERYALEHTETSAKEKEIGEMEFDHECPKCKFQFND